MREILLMLLALALAGCGSDYADRQQILDAQKPETVEALSRLRDLTLEPFEEWQAEDPASCNSHNLSNARASVLLTAGLVN
ncbi:MAG TPA: hypothetical protein VKU84_06935, partial [Stellaceae bacterium]|nr:hypothetical protein [Stellaceae bacterium]